MNPLNVGILEILVILALALVLFGPSKLISVVTSLRGALQEFQRAAQGVASSAVEEAKAETENDRHRPYRPTHPPYRPTSAAIEETTTDSKAVEDQPVNFQAEEVPRTSSATSPSAEPHNRSGPVE